ncbi:hypothetical protein [Pectinatus frisingensis]|uniref:hypothetical protein n=1 Tax=Pectinatus frisingensis TaxID=865 RepID=UPI0018C73938|nr:hypothetical protein [Pectinatus frisingensis]
MDALEMAIKDLVEYKSPDHLEHIAGYEYDDNISGNRNIKNLSVALKKYYLKKAGEMNE